MTTLLWSTGATSRCHDENASLAIHCDVFEHCFRTESDESQTLFIALIKFQVNCFELQKKESRSKYPLSTRNNVIGSTYQMTCRLKNGGLMLTDNL